MSYNIGKGWILKIVSWENDADNYSTDLINLRPEEKGHLDWLFAIIPYFQKSHHQKGPNGEAGYYVGNASDRYEIRGRLQEIMAEAFEKHWPDNEYYQEFPDDFEPFELLYDYGNAFCGMEDGQMSRKIESWKLYEVPEDISFKEVGSST